MALKYVDEYRSSEVARSYADQIARLVVDFKTLERTEPWRIMEVCGGQTHSIVKYGIDQLLPKAIELIHGPGCPVCVTPTSVIDSAIQLAGNPNVIFCSFGDMLRVPGTEKDLLSIKAEGGDIRIVYSPLDCLKTAQENPDREVVFLAVGFETTAPANAMAAFMAKKQGITNFSMLISQVLVPPALEKILGSENQIDGLLAPGHVCTIVGYQEYVPLSQKYQIPIVVTGFEPADILQGISMCVRQLCEGRFEVENQYTRAVTQNGNPVAIQILSTVFESAPKVWRGLGTIEKSGLVFCPSYREFDAETRFQLNTQEKSEGSPCISGLILQGLKKPLDCEQFGLGCNPERPLGATMVSSEGACSAYYRYRATHLSNRG